MEWLEQNWDLVVMVVVYLLDKLLGDSEWRGRVLALVNGIQEGVNPRGAVKKAGYSKDKEIGALLDKLQPKTQKRVGKAAKTVKVVTDLLPMARFVKGLLRR